MCGKPPKPLRPIPPLVTRQFLCQALRVSTRQLARYIKKGQIPKPTTRQGRTVGWKPDELPGLFFPKPVAL